MSKEAGAKRDLSEVLDAEAGTSSRGPKKKKEVTNFPEEEQQEEMVVVPKLKLEKLLLKVEEHFQIMEHLPQSMKKEDLLETMTTEQEDHHETWKDIRKEILEALEKHNSNCNDMLEFWKEEEFQTPQK